MNSIKKLGLTLMAVVMIAGAANAKIIAFGVKAGLNVNHLSYKGAVKDLTSKDNSAGWEAGVMAEVTIPIVGLGLDASLMYARMNNSTQLEFANPDSATGYEAFNGSNAGKNFIMIPINLKYKFQLPVVSKYLVPYIFTGPEFALKLDKNIVSDFKTKTCQVAWNVGVGIQLVSHLQIGASYGFGVNKIAEKISGINSQDYIRNNYWTVTAAWIF